MLDKTRPEYLNNVFQESVKELDRAIQKAKLIRKLKKSPENTILPTMKNLFRS